MTENNQNDQNDQNDQNNQKQLKQPKQLNVWLVLPSSKLFTIFFQERQLPLLVIGLKIEICEAN